MKPPASTPHGTRSRVAPQLASRGDAAIVLVAGMVDEHFPGFGDLGAMRTVVLDLGGVTFVTSFGVRQWLRSIAAVPRTVEHLYLANCPPIIVDQLNMILGFGGTAKILSLLAPFACAQCGAASKAPIDVIAERDLIAQGALAPRPCAKCGGALQLDELFDSYFACLRKYGATSVEPAALEVIAHTGSLRMATIAAAERARTAPVVVPEGDADEGASRRSPITAVIAVVLLVALAAAVYALVRPS